MVTITSDLVRRGRRSERAQHHYELLAASLEGRRIGATGLREWMGFDVYTSDLPAIVAQYQLARTQLDTSTVPRVGDLYYGEPELLGDPDWHWVHFDISGYCVGPFDIEHLLEYRGAMMGFLESNQLPSVPSSYQVGGLSGVITAQSIPTLVVP